ncbi:MAG: 30S ribosomal protein S12 methylthiotransferase RimO [Marinilabiliaceae bacterium]|jgi:ribosomal protein S12 methylthiotransferase|nr:30S ribosomal protein S12 methylthiotransferase RimO [Marinilabiliaceae bacterium]
MTQASSLNIITLGCSKNTVDSEKLLAQFAAAGYRVVYDKYNFDSEIVIINTCGFINDAKEESINTILHFAGAKKEGKIKKLYVMGCLSERYKDELRAEITEVEEFFGVNSPEEVVLGLKENYIPELVPSRILSGPSHYAYLKISEGCDRSCSFCAIPAIRGTYISRPVDDLVAEAAELAERGVRELILIAQDLSYYGLDLYKEQKLPDLLRALLKVEKLEWIRLHYLYPANFPLAILDIMATEPRLCNYIELPVQHISDRVLKLMKRSHGGPETRSLLQTIRKRLPEAAIRTSLISGHPGEDDTDHRELIDFISDFRFNRLGVFTYSHEENTFAANNYKDDIPESLKSERRDEIMEIQQAISLENNMALIGKTMKVIIDRKDTEYFYGRSEYDSPGVDQEILIPLNNQNLKPGDFTKVKIVSASEFDLIGEVIED